MTAPTRMSLDEFFETLDNSGGLHLAIADGLRPRQVPQMVEPHVLAYLQNLGEARHQADMIEQFRPDSLGYVI